jgi:hypothetical protein
MNLMPLQLKSVLNWLRRGSQMLLLFLCPFAVSIVGCDRDDVKVYRVAKEQPEKSNLPEGWTATPPGQMRVASFAVQGDGGKKADVSVIPLPGAAGGVFANVNRWRGQVGLPPASEDEVKKMAEPVQISGQPAELYDIAGKNSSSGEPERILASIQERDGMAWFFKMTGDDGLVAKQKPAFIAFLKTFDASAVSPASGMASSLPPSGMGELPPGHPDIGNSLAGGGEVSHEGQPKWEVPSGWQEVPAEQFLVAKFIVTGNTGAKAAVNVSDLAGDGGGVTANVNRWRKQLGMSDISEAEIIKLASSVDVAGGKATLVDLSGTDARSGQPSQMVGVIVPQGGQTWFYKLMGDPKVVAAQKETFTKFVETVKY